MAVKNISVLADKLIENGRPADTPVAVVRWGTRADQETVTTTLEHVARDVRERDIKPPAVMVVGDVVRLREELNWYETKPLFGVRILVTRENSRGFEPLEELGAEVIEFPTIRIEVPGSWEEMDRATDDFLRAAAQAGQERGLDIRDLKGLKVCAVGSKTAAAVGERGMTVDMVPEAFRAEGLVEAFKKLAGSGDLRGMRFLLPRAEKAREVFPDAVREKGGEIVVPVAYRAVMPQRHPKRLERFLREGRITIATFTSGATFKNFLELVPDGRELLTGVSIAAIGPVTKKTVEKSGLSVEIMPEEATIEAMVEEIIAWAAVAERKDPNP
jgi:uroporphyrinogen III methyltransferase/synthase